MLILVISNSLYSQKTIIPRNGDIVFVKKEIITDTLLYKTSYAKVFDKMLPEMKKEILTERGYGNSQIPDAVNLEVNQILEMMKLIVLEDIVSDKSKNLIKYHHAYKNSEIEEFISVNGEKKILDINDYGNDDLLFITEVKEYKNETKIIKDFKCYKVVVYYFNLDEPPGLKSLLNVMELWVTESIKSHSHPFIKSNKILNKYFPLEIKHNIKGVEGMYTSYELLDFSLK